MKKALLLMGLILVLLFTQLVTNANTPAMALDKKDRVHSKHTSSFTPRVSYWQQKGPIDEKKALSPRADSTGSSDLETSVSKNPVPAKKEDTPSRPNSLQFAKGLLQNASKPLTTPTYDKIGQAVHPSVIDFKVEYNLDSWRGYRYWMVMTPYPNGNESYENPSLLASEDGLKWVVPDGFLKPLDVLPGKINFNSDPTLVYDPDQKSLLIYWRETLRGELDRIWRIEYPLKGRIQPKILVLEEPWGKKNTLSLSPSVWRKSAKEWYLWTVTGTNIINLYDSPDGIHWGNRRELQPTWLDWNGGFVPWHLEVKPNLPQKKLDIVMSGWPKGQKSTDMILVYAESPMSDLSQITFPLDQPLLTNGAANQWDDDFIYKSSFVREDKEGQSLYHIWYSARSIAGQWHTGYTSGTLGHTE